MENCFEHFQRKNLFFFFWQCCLKMLFEGNEACSWHTEAGGAVPWQSSMFSLWLFFCLHITSVRHVWYISNEVQDHALHPPTPTPEPTLLRAYMSFKEKDVGEKSGGNFAPWVLNINRTTSASWNFT